MRGKGHRGRGPARQHPHPDSPAGEIIVSDDGSTDATPGVVRSVAERSPIPIQIHRNEHDVGFAANFLTATTPSKGSNVASSDQHDRWSRTKLQDQYEALLEYRADLCVHPVDLIDDRGPRIAEDRRRRERTQVVAALESNPWGNFCSSRGTLRHG